MPRKSKGCGERGEAGCDSSLATSFALGITQPGRREPWKDVHRGVARTSGSFALEAGRDTEDVGDSRGMYALPGHSRRDESRLRVFTPGPMTSSWLARQRDKIPLRDKKRNSDPSALWSLRAGMFKCLHIQLASVGAAELWQPVVAFACAGPQGEADATRVTRRAFVISLVLCSCWLVRLHHQVAIMLMISSGTEVSSAVGDPPQHPWDKSRPIEEGHSGPRTSLASRGGDSRGTSDVNIQSLTYPERYLVNRQPGRYLWTIFGFSARARGEPNSAEPGISDCSPTWP